MNEIEARTLSIVRTFESPFDAPWSAPDAEAVTREAARDVGESASPERFLARRAEIAAARLAERDVVASSVLRRGTYAISKSLAVVALLVAFGIGFASESVSADGRINILAPPLLALILWNLAVYAALLVAWLRRRRPAPSQPRAIGPAYPLRTLLMDSVQRFTAMPRRASGPWLRFAGEWSRASRPLQAQRISALLHAGAVAFACGALASLYLRGLVFEYRAGWDSTFLTPAAVHDWLGLVLGPASTLSGIALPTPDGIAALRFSTGNGENAARWIHLYAISVAAIVVWPRGWLAAAALRRARRIASEFPVDLHDPYFQRLLRGRSGAALRVRLLPYGRAPDAPDIDRLKRLIEHVGGQRANLSSLAPIEQGDEDDTALIENRIDGDDRDSMLLVLFTLAATPERETHGRLLDTLQAVAPRCPQTVLVDEASFVGRFAAAMPRRVDERRDAWRRMLREVGRTPVFVDLSTDAPMPDEASLRAVLETSMR